MSEDESSVSKEQLALDNDRLIDVSTIGRKSGKAHRFETGFYRFGGEYYLSGLPGKRDWYANLLAHPQFTIHLKQSVTADITATAHPVEDDSVRNAVIGYLVTNWGMDDRREEFLASSPLLSVTIDAR